MTFRTIFGVRWDFKLDFRDFAGEDLFFPGGELRGSNFCYIFVTFVILEEILIFLLGR